MTPDQILARLKTRYPNLEWAAQDYPNHVSYDGRARDEQGTPILSLTVWGDNAGYHANRVDLWVCGSPRPQFLSIEAALDWLEWLQGVMARA